MIQIQQQSGQSLIDIALSQYGTIQGLESLFLNNPEIGLHSQGQTLTIEPKIYDSRSSKILDLFQDLSVEVIGKDETEIGSELVQFSEQFSEQFF